MALLLIPALPQTDQIFSHLQVPQEYYDYLSAQGVGGATVTSTPPPSFVGEAWGVDQEAINLFARYAIPYTPPSIEIVKKINSRDFAAQISQQLSTGIPQTELIESLDSFWAYRKKVPTFVIKPLFGNAGSGFIYSFGPINSEDAARALLNSDGSFVIEPWLEKTLDIATLIEISPSGEITIKGHHRNVSNRAGAFYANIILRDDPAIRAYRTTLDDYALKVAHEVYKSGYWGPLGLDSILYKDTDTTEKLAFGFDINARHPISTISYGIREKLGNPPALMYRFIANRRVRKLNSQDELLRVLERVNHSFGKENSVLLTTPFAYYDEYKLKKNPARYSFIIKADSEKELETIDAKLRAAILR